MESLEILLDLFLLTLGRCLTAATGCLSILLDKLGRSTRGIGYFLLGNAT
jgi:hypothetical protein